MSTAFEIKRTKGMGHAVIVDGEIRAYWKNTSGGYELYHAVTSLWTIGDPNGPRKFSRSKHTYAAYRVADLPRVTEHALPHIPTLAKQKEMAEAKRADARERNAKYEAEQRETERRERIERAGPKLLAILKELLKPYEGSLGPRWVDQARAVIAEAEGEQHEDA